MEILKKQLLLFFTTRDIKLVQALNGNLLLFPESPLTMDGLPNGKKGEKEILHLFSWNYFKIVEVNKRHNCRTIQIQPTTSVATLLACRLICGDLTIKGRCSPNIVLDGKTGIVHYAFCIMRGA